MSTDDILGKLILPIGGLLALVASNVIDSGATTQATLEWASHHHPRAYVGAILALLAVPCLMAGIVAHWSETSRSSVKLAWLAAASLTLGYVGLAANDGAQALSFALAADGKVDLVGLAKTIDADLVPVVFAKILAFGGWLAGILIGVAAPAPQIGARAIGLAALLSVPFVSFAPWLPAACLSGGILMLVGSPFLVRWRA